MVEDEFVQICPVCGSRKFNFYKKDKVTEIVAQEQFQCARCKNLFYVPFEIPATRVSEIKEAELSSNLLCDTPLSAYVPVGMFEVGVYWKILGFFLLLLGIGFLGIGLSENILLSLNLIFIGVANILVSIYLFFESFVVFKLHQKPTRRTRFLLSIGFLFAVYVVNVYQLAIFYIPNL